jgi:hypothetical protein
MDNLLHLLSIASSFDSVLLSLSSSYYLSRMEPVCVHDVRFAPVLQLQADSSVILLWK